jgi:MFS family permease
LTKARSFYEITQSYPSITKFYGLLSGAGFSISYAIAGVLWGIAADKYNRKRIITAACFGWSITSFFTGSVDSLAVLAIMRFFLGICQSAFLPSSFSIVQDYFPSNKLAVANSMITAAPLLGAGLSSLSVLLIAKTGWRACY